MNFQTKSVRKLTLETIRLEISWFDMKLIVFLFALSQSRHLGESGTHRLDLNLEIPGPNLKTESFGQDCISKKINYNTIFQLWNFYRLLCYGIVNNWLDQKRTRNKVPLNLGLTSNDEVEPFISLRVWHFDLFNSLIVCKP